MNKPYYTKAKVKTRWWCIVHNRPATHLLHREGMKPKFCCDPKLGGIMVPCIVEYPKDENS